MDGQKTQEAAPTDSVDTLLGTLADSDFSDGVSDGGGDLSDGGDSDSGDLSEAESDFSDGGTALNAYDALDQAEARRDSVARHALAAAERAEGIAAEAAKRAAIAEAKRQEDERATELAREQRLSLEQEERALTPLRSSPWHLSLGEPGECALTPLRDAPCCADDLGNPENELLKAQLSAMSERLQMAEERLQQAEAALLCATPPSAVGMPIDVVPIDRLGAMEERLQMAEKQALRAARLSVRQSVARVTMGQMPPSKVVQKSTSPVQDAEEHGFDLVPAQTDKVAVSADDVPRAATDGLMPFILKEIATGWSGLSPSLACVLRRK